MNQPTKNNNKNVQFIMYFFLFIFLFMMGYFVFFLTIKSEEFINNPYNSLQDLFSERIIRGDILSSDGHILATSKLSKDGVEQREYPYGKVFAHAIGYSTNGKAGLENQANFSLLQSHSFFLDQMVNDIKEKKSKGDSIVTTLDFDLQALAYDSLGNYDGAVIVLEPDTGKILCMVSKPAYDPNNIEAEWDNIITGESSVLFNRATQGQYTPGSVFKLFPALEYYRENKNTHQNYSFDCAGEFTYKTKTIHCAAGQKHGMEDLTQSVANSCNSSFANLSLEIDKDKLMELCDSLLFNEALPISFESGVSKLSISNEDDYAYVLETGIGQGLTLVSPLHMAMLMGAIDHNGILMRPYLIDHIQNPDGIFVSENSPNEYAVLLSQDECTFLNSLLKAVVEEGTAKNLSGQSYEAFGKTGTAQVSDKNTKENSWFVGYAKMDGYHDIAIAVVIEDFSNKDITGVTVAKKIFDSYFAGRVY